jgi:hypothetical protein
MKSGSPLLIAHALGYFREEGIDAPRPVMVRSWKILIESFLAGKFNLTHMLFPIPVWMKFKQKIPVKVLAWDHTNGSAVTVQGNSDIKGFADLGGKKIAVPSWYSTHNLIMQMGIRARGLTPVIKSHQRTYYQCRYHNNGLNHIGINHAAKTAVYGVGNNNRRRNQHAGNGINAEHCVQGFAATEKLSPNVKKEEKYY